MRHDDWPPYPDPSDWAAEPTDVWPGGHPGLDSPTGDRLLHLVFVDGRLVDTWREPVAGTPWQHLADRLDRELRPPPPPPPPPPPLHVQVLDWVAAVCGGRGAMERLDTDPLQPADDSPLAALDEVSGHRLRATANLLDDALGNRCADELGVALHRALVDLGSREPETVRGAAAPARLAAGICWAVGRANGVFRPAGWMAQKDVQETLGLSGALSVPGRTVHRALLGSLVDPGRPPAICPALLPLGRTDLLTAATRRQLIRLRDRAQADSAHADQAESA